MKFLPLLLALILLGAPRASRADPLLPPLDLYSARTMVSGQGETNRQTGFSTCLIDVLVKVSGDATLAADPRVEQLASHAAEYVLSYTYRDRMQGRPLHDEQGSYDRPHYLTVTFDPGRIAAALRSMGRSPWTAERPRVVVLLSVQGRKASFVLASDDDVDVSADMRSALSAASEKTGIPIEVPDHATLSAAGITADAPPAAVATGASAVAAGGKASAALVGALSWSEPDHGWIAQWRLQGPATATTWGERGVNFDEAFRQALLGVAQAYSGHGSAAPD